MRVFVTGGNGFIGSEVVRTLIASGHSVRCLLRETSRVERLAGLPFDRATGDVRDIESVRTAMAQCDCTVHLAAPGGWEKDDPSVLGDVIEGGARNVLAAASGFADHRVLLVSSSAAIGASDTPMVFDETAEFDVQDPALHYAHAKHKAEELARDACGRGVPVIIVNPSEVYGPGDTALVSAGNLIDFATSTPVLVCHGGTSIVHVSDVATGIIAALERGRPGERYILGGDNLSVRELAELVLELVGRHTRIVTVPNGFARLAARIAARLPMKLPFNPHVVPYATRYWFVDNSKARRELGISFRGARATIAPTIDWLEQAGLLMPHNRKS
jgi:dihydroflavonol-4-reductase